MNIDRIKIRIINQTHHSKIVDTTGDLTGATTTSDTSPVQANSSQRVLIVTAVDAEKDAVLRGLGNTAAERFDVIAAALAQPRPQQEQPLHWHMP